MVYFPAIKKNKILSLAAKWMELEDNMFSRTSLMSIACFLSYVKKN